jgi:Protein of unknown function (DUF2934)
MQNLEETIRERAYHLWVADGRPDGNAEAYWLSAQREILTTSLDSSVTQAAESGVTEPAKKAKARSGRSKRRAA